MDRGERCRLMNRISYMSLVAVLLFIGTISWVLEAAEAKPRTKPTVPFMRQKMLYTQGVIEGLVTEDYELIMRNGRRLGDMTVSNVWITIRHPDYMKHVSTYQERVADLVQAGRQANLKKSTKAFNRVMESCVECHRDYRLKQWHRQLEGR